MLDISDQAHKYGIHIHGIRTTRKLFQNYLLLLTYFCTGLDFKGPTPISYVVKRTSFPDAKEYDLHLSVTTIFGTTETTSTSICFKEGIIIPYSPCW